MESLDRSSREGILNQLQALKGAEVSKLSEFEYRVGVTDKEAWDMSLKQLGIFSPLLKDAYGWDDSQLDRQLEITLKHVDAVFVITDGARIVGLTSIERHPTDVAVVVIREIVVAQDVRGTGKGKALYERIFAEPKLNAVISATANPAAVANRMTVAGGHGFETYWGNMGSGNPEVERLRGLDMQYLQDGAVLADQTLPPGEEGFALVHTEYVPPIEEKSVQRLDPASEVYAQGQRMLELQKQYAGADGRPTCVVVGHLISVRGPDIDSVNEAG